MNHKLFLEFIQRIFFVIMVLCGVSTSAQFSVHSTPNGKIENILKGKSLAYENGICSYLHNILNPLAKPGTIGNTGILDADITIDSCRFTESPKTVNSTLQECFSVNLQFSTGHQGVFSHNRFEQPLVISGLSGTLIVAENEMPYLFFSGCKNGDLTIVGNRIPMVVHFKQVQGRQLNINNNIFKKDTALITLMNSSFGQVFVGENKAKKMRVQFFNDTLNTVILQNDLPTGKKSASQLYDISFFRCRLNGDIWPQLNPADGSRSYRFDACDFSADSHLIGLVADTIEFRNCLHFEKGMVFECDPGTKPTILKLEHSDLTGLDFEYDSRLQLYHSQDPDVTRSNFEKLLAKFQNEKKLGSYRHVDIEYFQFRHSWLLSGINMIWWNYSYDKWLVFVWTVFLLIVFTLINEFCWKKVHETYSVVKISEIESTQGTSRWLKLFVFTALIFFSLRIDFSKLSFKHAGWLSYFFIQYIFGVLCLFFIANYILKLG